MKAKSATRKKVTEKTSPRQRIALAGRWERWLGDKALDTIPVPSSYRPIGVASLRRRVNMPAVGETRRAVLRMEGITHQAQVRINGRDIGSLDPWTPYEFDITPAVQPGSNDIEVEVSDWQVPLGPSNAWEAYGGIIRNLFIDLRPDPYIENVRLQYEISPKLDRADCTADLFLKSTVEADAEVAVQLYRGTKAAAGSTAKCRVERGASQVTLKFTVNKPALWSPEKPNLYCLKATIQSPRGCDLYEITTGLRDLRIEGNKFILNGRQFVVKGVGRHDLWPIKGHTMTDAQVEKDMRMIKAMGANFVRNVHYPHDRRIIEAADRLGLFVSEESGLIWLDFTKCGREVQEIGFQNLERTIRRDWNSPSVFAILLANESSGTVDMAKEGTKRVKALVPKMLVSTAHFGEPETVKKIYDESGLDFYTQHPYTYDMYYFAKAAKLWNDRPLVFSEWGGRVIGQSPLIMEPTIEEFRKLVQDSKLAGHVFWGWADLPEFGRHDKEMEGGILKSGVVTEQRIVRTYVRNALMKLYRYSPCPQPAPSRKPRLLRAKVKPLCKTSRFTPVSLQAVADDSAQAKAWSEMETLMERFWASHTMAQFQWEETGKRFWFWSLPKLSLGGVPFRTALRDGLTHPIVLTPGCRKVEIPIGTQADRLHILGNITLPDGYPIIGQFGGRVGRYVIVYEDGRRQEAPLRWGIEIARSNIIANATRIDPATSCGERVIVYNKHTFREIYQTRLLSIDTQGGRVDRLICELDMEKISSEKASAANEETLPGQSFPSGKPRPLAITEQTMFLLAVTAEKGKKS